MISKETLVLIALIFILFTIKNFLTLDPDFGWHIRMGEIISKSGVPATDPLSYTMPDYPFVDHEWLTNLLMAKMYAVIGKAGLALLFASLAVAALLLQLPQSFKKWSYLPLLLVASTVFSFVGIRTQLITWCLFSVFILLLRREDKRAYVSPVLVGLELLWVNLHGGFPLGIVIYGIYLTAYLFLQKKLLRRHLLTLLALCAVTFLNPYGYRIWWEVWMQMTDSALRNSIVEWMPAIMFINIPLWVYGVFTTTLFVKYRRHFSLFDKLLYGVLLFAGISTYRHIPLWCIASLTLCIKSMALFHNDIRTIQYGEKRLRRVLLIFTVTMTVYSVYHLSDYFQHMVTEKNAYPAKAVAYLRSRKSEGNIFNYYGWGGYLSWKLPEKKVFIDGRMPSWRWDSPYKDESDYAFMEYRDAMADEKRFMEIARKYNISYIITPQKKEMFKGILDRHVEDLLRKFLPMTTAIRKKHFFTKMEVVYKDEVTVIYRVTQD